MTFKQKYCLHFDCCMKIKEPPDRWLFYKSELSFVLFQCLKSRDHFDLVSSLLNESSLHDFQEQYGS